MDKAQREREALDSMAATDVILPSQFFGAMGGGGLCSEQRLMLAVLVDAINILQGWNRLGSVRKRRAFAEASQWIITRGTHHPFAFDSVCDALGIDPSMLRGRLNGLAMGHGVSDRRPDRHDAALACAPSCRFSVRAACARDVVEELIEPESHLFTTY